MARTNAKAGGKANRAARRPAEPPFELPPGWRLDRGGRSISIHVRAADFLDALALFREVAKVAEALEHHPDLHLTRWNRVRIATWSHDAGGLTTRDERLALHVNEVLLRRSKRRRAST